MKALKEKRNSFRSLWRMGLVILSVFALVLAACGNSNTADPVGTPSVPVVTPQQPNGQGTGGTPAPAKVITRMEIATPVGANYSKEGQRPNLGGDFRVYVWYDDGGMETLGQGAFNTTPAILGEEYINVANHNIPEKKTIYITHRTLASPAFPVEIPGVQAFMENFAAPGANLSGRGETSVRVGSTVKVWGNNGAGVTFSGDYSGLSFFEDGLELTAEDLNRITVLVKYDELTGVPSAAMSADYERLWLTTDHIFTDYTSNWINDGTPSAAALKVPYAYGIDPIDNVVNILLSKGTVHGSQYDKTTFVAQNNTSVFLRVPFGSYYKVSKIELKNLAWRHNDATGTSRSYLMQPTVLGWSMDRWTQALTDYDIELEVSYYGTTEKKNRDKYDFLRAVRLQRAGVYNEPIVRQRTPTLQYKTTDDDDYGDVVIGYYASLPNAPLIATDRNPVKNGDYPNIWVTKAPIAVYREGNMKLEFQTAYNPKDKDLDFVTDATNNTAYMTDQQLLALQVAYEVWGDFQYGSEAIERAMLMPGRDLRKEFFSPLNPFTTTEPQGELKEVSFVIPSAQNLLAWYSTSGSDTAGDRRQRFGARNSSGQYPDAAGLAVQYGLYAGEDTSINTMVYPVGYDRR